MQAMTRQHFEALADALRECIPLSKQNDATQELFNLLIGSIANVCSRANPAFNHGEWLARINASPPSEDDPTLARALMHVISAAELLGWVLAVHDGGDDEGVCKGMVIGREDYVDLVSEWFGCAKATKA